MYIILVQLKQQIIFLTNYNTQSNKMTHFSYYAVQATSNVVSQILQSGANILYHKYLNQKIPAHLTQQRINVLKNMASVQMKQYDNQYQQIQNDQEIKSSIRDNYLIKSTQIKKISMGSVSKYKSINDNPPMAKIKQKNRFKHKFDIRELKNEKKQVSDNVLKKKNNDLIALQLPNQISSMQLQTIHYENNARKTKIQQAIQLKQQQKKQKQRSQFFKTQRILMQKQFKQIKDKNLKHTYDFSGKILQCASTDKNINRIKSLHPQIGIKVINQAFSSKQVNKFKRKESTNQNRIESIIAQQININNIRQQQKKGPNIHLSRFSKHLGTDPIKNQIFNNNNNRQTSNIKLIQLSQGTKLTQIQNKNSIQSQRKFNNITKRQYNEKNDTKFKSFFITVRQDQQPNQYKYFLQDRENEQFKNQSEYQTIDKKQNQRSNLHTAMSSRKPLSRENNKEQRFRTITAMRGKTPPSGSKHRSELIRPTTCGNGKQKILVQNRNMIEILLD